MPHRKLILTESLTITKQIPKTHQTTKSNQIQPKERNTNINRTSLQVENIHKPFKRKEA